MPRPLTEEEVGAFRERLCSAAERLFAEQGPRAASMRQLAAKLGVSPMTPYRYFKDKDDILAAVRASGFNRFSEALEKAYRSAADPNAQALAVGNAYFRFAFENPAAYRLMFDLDQPTEADYPDLVRATERSKRIIHTFVEGLIAAGHLQGDVTLISYVFLASIHGIVVLHLAGKLPEPIGVARLGLETLRALVRAYRPPGEGGPG